MGGGIAGLCTALYLCLRGEECILVEKNYLGSGTTTKCAGMLHSGARYIVNDPGIAKCLNQESQIIKKIVSFAVGKQRGLFVILRDADNNYLKNFEEGAKLVGIEINKLSRQECLELEPALGPEIIGGYETPDVTIDPFLLIDAYKEELLDRGVKILEKHELIKGSITSDGKWKLFLRNENMTELISILGDVIINATGDSSSDIISRLGGKFGVTYIHGSMAVLKEKIVNRVVSVCGPNTAGDVITPSGQTSLIGSTWHELNHNQPVEMTNNDKDEVIRTASRIIPNIINIPIVHSFTGIRVHLSKSSRFQGQNSFNINRSFQIIDHSQNNKLPEVYTILPGKLSFGRLAAEYAVNMIMTKRGEKASYATRDYLLRVPRKKSGITLDMVSNLK